MCLIQKYEDEKRPSKYPIVTSATLSKFLTPLFLVTKKCITLTNLYNNNNNKNNNNNNNNRYNGEKLKLKFQIKVLILCHVS